MSYYNLCGIGSQHSNISKGKKVYSMSHFYFCIPWLESCIPVIFICTPPLPFFLLKYYCVVIQYHTNCNNSYLCYINPCFWISSGSFNYLLNLGRVTSEGSRNNVSINRNWLLPEVSPLLSVVSHFSLWALWKRSLNIYILDNRFQVYIRPLH
jgi:hypothetical protein